ncbi:hypothetical protein AGMMS50268_19670 [Spirochaetia bacterium]|nr:hypothetical protein AGMMS50268_19670 [Spirochaetia bacterium]
MIVKYTCEKCRGIQYVSYPLLGFQLPKERYCGICNEITPQSYRSAMNEDGPLNEQSLSSTDGWIPYGDEKNPIISKK